MKRTIIAAMALLLSVGAAAQEKTISMRAREAKAAGGATLEAFETELQSMLSAGNEQAYLDASNAYYALGNQGKYEEIHEQVLKKFPHGIYARSQACNKLYQIQGGAELEKAYKEWEKTYPQKKLGFDIVCDYAAYSVDNNYAKENNEEKAMEYLHRLQDKGWKSTGIAAISTVFRQRGNMQAVERCLKEACEACDEARAEADPRLVRDYANTYVAYADVLLANGKEEAAMEQYNKVGVEQRGLFFAKLMMQKGHPMHAFALAEDMLRSGEGNTAHAEQLLREAWHRANGNDEGCQQYLADMRAQLKAQKQKEIKAMMIKEPAPHFCLLDAQGHPVRLSDLQGKVVVVDFWATWCGPCKASLPAMKKTVEKYKDDANVEFLFIHTWERGTPEEALASAKEYLQTNGFGDFHLVMDTRDKTTRTNKAVSAFGVSGIPAKFIIDPKGDIRFKVSGFGGNDEAAVEELTQMIEMARK